MVLDAEAAHRDRVDGGEVTARSATSGRAAAEPALAASSAVTETAVRVARIGVMLLVVGGTGRH